MPVITLQIPVGTRFFRWVTLTEVRRIPGKTGRYAKCVCDCGTVKEVLAHDLNRGASLSCKCFNKEVVSKQNTTHGGSRVSGRERLNSIWRNMKSRCHNSNTPSYKQYGARGISVCELWRTSYAAFRTWALASGYADDLEIDRRDNNVGYSPENCQWVTPKQNANNKQQSRYLTAFGETKTLLDWSNDARCVVGYNTIHLRLRKGWSDTDAISKLPLHPDGRHETAFGETMIISLWLRGPRCVVSPVAVYRRLSAGWRFEEAISTPAGVKPTMPLSL